MPASSVLTPEVIEHARRLVEQAPPLTAAMSSRLAVLLQVAPAPDNNGKRTTPGSGDPSTESAA